MSSSPSRVPTLGVALAVGVLLLAGFFAWRGLSAQAESSELVARTYEVSAAVQTMSVSLAEAEDSAESAPPDRARVLASNARARDSLAKAQSTSTDATVQTKLAELRGPLEAYTAALEADPPRPRGAVAESRSRIAAKIAEVSREEDKIRAVRVGEMAAGRERSLRALVASSLLGGFLLLFSFSLVGRENRARAEAESRAVERERQLATTLASIGDAVVVADVAGHVLDMNPAAEELLGRTEEEAKGGQVADLLGLSEAGEGRLSAVLASGDPVQIADGEASARDRSVPLAGTFAPIRTDTGKILGVVGVLRDAGAERREELRFKRIVESAPDALVIVKPDGTIWSVNDRVTQLYGYGQNDLVGSPIEKLLPERFRAGHVAHRARFHASPTTRPMGQGGLRLIGLRKNGEEFPAAISLAPIELFDEVYAIAAIRDISEQIAAAEELRRAKEQSEAANRELEAFSYSVAHDLRAPLRSIDGFSHALEEDYAASLDDTGKEYLTLVRESAKRMADLIDDLLALSRVARTELHREKVDLAELARGVSGDLRRRDPARAVEFVIADALPVDADARLVGIALENLLGNAWKFSAKAASPRIEVGVTERDGAPAFFVRDNGAGFDMANAKRLFTPFQRLHSDKDYEGTGIGLATVQRIIARHHGRIWADAKPGEGATFYFTLG